MLLHRLDLTSPFCALACFVALQFIAADEKLPALLRYNMLQAVRRSTGTQWWPRNCSPSGHMYDD
eukprot:12350541-Alexandrium_andersonii.AAC.1